MRCVVCWNDTDTLIQCPECHRQICPECIETICPCCKKHRFELDDLIELNVDQLKHWFDRCVESRLEDIQATHQANVEAFTAFMDRWRTKIPLIQYVWVTINELRQALDMVHEYEAQLVTYEDDLKHWKEKWNTFMERLFHETGDWSLRRSHPVDIYDLRDQFDQLAKYSETESYRQYILTAWLAQNVSPILPRWSFHGYRLTLGQTNAEGFIKLLEAQIPITPALPLDVNADDCQMIVSVLESWDIAEETVFMPSQILQTILDGDTAPFQLYSSFISIHQPDEIMAMCVCPICHAGVCLGLSSGLWQCNRCHMIVCPRCCKPHRQGHVCNDDDVKTWQSLKSMNTICPNCGVMIAKVEGTCDDMWCDRCNTGFDYKTRKRITHAFHNPERMKYIERIGKREGLSDVLLQLDSTTRSEVIAQMLMGLPRQWRPLVSYVNSLLSTDPSPKYNDKYDVEPTLAHVRCFEIDRMVAKYTWEFIMSVCRCVELYMTPRVRREASKRIAKVNARFETMLARLSFIDEGSIIDSMIRHFNYLNDICQSVDTMEVQRFKFHDRYEYIVGPFYKRVLGEDM